MHRQELTSLSLSCLLLLGLWCPAERVGAAGPDPPPPESGEPADWEWGSGSPPLLLLQDLLHSFPADSPFTTEAPGKPANCSQRFWLPPRSPVCWDDVARPEEFAKSRLLVLQNRAFLQAVSTSSGVEEGGVSYQQQARDEVQGARTDNLNTTETIVTMQQVFLSLEEKRREEKGLWVSSIKEKISGTNAAIAGREQQAAHLEEQFSSLEASLLVMQHRLNTLIPH